MSEEFRNSLHIQSDDLTDPKKFHGETLCANILEEMGANKSILKNPMAIYELRRIFDDIIESSSIEINGFYEVSKENIAEVKSLIKDKIKIGENGSIIFDKSRKDSRFEYFDRKTFSVEKDNNVQIDEKGYALELDEKGNLLFDSNRRATGSLDHRRRSINEHGVEMRNTYALKNISVLDLDISKLKSIDLINNNNYLSNYLGNGHFEQIDYAAQSTNIALLSVTRESSDKPSPEYSWGFRDGQTIAYARSNFNLSNKEIEDEKKSINYKTLVKYAKVFGEKGYEQLRYIKNTLAEQGLDIGEEDRQN